MLVVGAGPSGMSAAYQLRRQGHAVTVMDAGPRVGGMMRFGIPKYRLPRDVLDAEMQRIVEMGVTVKLDAKVDDVARTMKEGGYDAAFLAVGAHIAKRAFIPAKDSARILDAVAVLRSMEGEEQPMLGRRVVVYGGGNTAIDVARTAKRLGATEAVIVYRRTRERMPALDFEVEEALEEGVLVKWLSTIKQAGDGDADDREDGARRKGQPAADRRASRRCRPTRWCSRSARTSTSLCSTACPAWSCEDGVVQVDPATMMTGHAGLFAGGDMVPADRNVTVAHRPRQEGGAPHRRLAARHADRRRRPSTRRRPSSASTPGTTATRRRRCARSSTSRGARAASTRCRAASPRTTRCSRRAAA